jgi:hypothetical protein
MNHLTGARRTRLYESHCNPIQERGCSVGGRIQESALHGGLHETYSFLKTIHGQTWEPGNSNLPRGVAGRLPRNQNLVGWVPRLSTVTGRISGS